MRTDELYKFSDGTLTSVRSVLHDITSNLRMYYLPKKRWSSLDRKRSRIMIKAIDQLLLERRYRCSFPRSSQNPRDLPSDIPLDRIEFLRNTKLLFGIEDSHHEPSDAMHNPSLATQDSLLQVGNPVKEILLKLNLPDHRSILMDSKIHIKMVMEVPGSNRLKDL
ncbi:hypothetical protein Tco_0313221 [Tanacetum coccineum]